MRWLLALLLFAVPLASFGGIGEWHSVTNKSKIEDLALSGNQLIAATNGGVLVIDSSTGEVIASFTNTEGISSNHPMQVIVDQSGNWWLGMANGDINLYVANQKQWNIRGDFSGFTIYDFQQRGDSMFVALDIGVSVYLIDRREAKETYKNLGDIPVNAEATVLAVKDDVLWVGTNNGLAYADLNQVNLKAPQSWRNLHTKDGLLSEKIKAISFWQDALFVGTDAGVQKWVDNAWTTYSDLPSTRVIQFLRDGAKFYLILRNHILRYDEATDAWIALHFIEKNITCAVMDEEGRMWLGTESDGVLRLNLETGENDAVVVNQPGGNYFADLAVTPNGELWCATGALFGAGIYRFDGQNWINYSKKQEDIPADNTTAVTVDHSGGVWIGSWGRGLFHFEGDHFQVYNAQSGHLPGIPNDLGYAVVNALAVDQTGTLWMTTFNAHNENLLIALTPEGEWVYFSPDDGILSTNPLCIAVDQFNRKWIGTDGAGVYVYDDNFTPTDKSDDTFAGTLTTVDGLQGNRITALAIDEFNTVWIGSNNGLDYYQGGRVFPQYGLITNDINCIEIDPVGNKWIGTSSGFSILDRDDLTFKHFTQENSPLVSPNVLSIAFDGRNGFAYIGTTNGLSIWETLFTEPKENLNQLKVYPNPLLIGGAEEPALIIDGLSREVAINIYSASGFRVRTLVSASKGGRAVWDGRNDNGQLVASGIYLVVAAQPDGVSRSAKVIVVKQ